MSNAADYQKTLIKLIHVARRELAMSDDDYRAMLAGIPELEGVTSTAGLPIPKLQAVLEQMKRLGFKVRPNNKSKGKPHNFNASSMPAPITKIEALLADMGLPWSYADAIAEQMFGIKRCAWVRDRKQQTALISALHVEQVKRIMEATTLNLLDKLNSERRAFYTDQLPENWNRRRPLMKALIERLIVEVDQ